MAFTRSQRLTLAIIPRLAALLIRGLGATLRYHDVYGPGGTRGDLLPGPFIYAFWHRTLLVCAHRFRNQRIVILISRSFDGELIARTVERLGFIAVRGSSSRGGAAGLRAMAEAYQQGGRCAITVDGPRGPNMVAQPGAAQLALLVEAPWIGTYHASPQSAWTLNTWDQFLIPRPFSRVVFTWPARLPVGPQDTVETLQPTIQSALDLAVHLAVRAHTPSR